MKPKIGRTISQNIYLIPRSHKHTCISRTVVQCYAVPFEQLLCNLSGDVNTVNGAH